MLPSFHPVGQALYDATNPEARKQYWANANAALFQKGVDAWWLDTDEPETEGTRRQHPDDEQAGYRARARGMRMSIRCFTRAGFRMGSGRLRTRSACSFLSRSAYAGSQRYGVTAWSGDVLSDWVTFQRQIPAGLNYAISGMPYWTTDIGGFISGGNLNDPKFRELFVRWFQFGAFSPIFRVHGTRNPR